MNSYRPLIALLVGATALVFSACEKDSSTECTQETISDVTYFETDRTLSNTCTKTEGIDYFLTGEQTYYISANVVIEPGTTIELDDGASLVITNTGSLSAVGTTDEPIIIRGSYKTTGHWGGIFVRSSSYDNKLQYVQLERGGGASIDGETATGTVVLLDEGTIAISNSAIKESASYAINMASEEASLWQCMNNTITTNNKPLYLHPNQATIISSDNDFSGNTHNYIEVGIGSTLTTHAYWPTVNIPYRVIAGSTASIQYISAGSLNIGAGNTVEMSEGTGFEVSSTGAMTAIGTASAPILFTGVSKAYGTWKGFSFKFTQEDNQFEHVRIEHAGGGQSGVVYMWGDPKIMFSNVEMTYSPSCAFYDAPKSSSQSMNSNLIILNMSYSYVDSQYCKGS